MDATSLNVASATLGAASPILIWRGRRRTSRMIEGSLQAIEASVVTIAEARGPVVVGMEKHRARAAVVESGLTTLGLLCLLLSFVLRLVALLVR